MAAQQDVKSDDLSGFERLPAELIVRVVEMAAPYGEITPYTFLRELPEERPWDVFSVGWERPDRTAWLCDLASISRRMHDVIYSSNVTYKFMVVRSQARVARVLKFLRDNPVLAERVQALAFILDDDTDKAKIINVCPRVRHLYIQRLGILDFSISLPDSCVTFSCGWLGDGKAFNHIAVRAPDVVHLRPPNIFYGHSTTLDPHLIARARSLSIAGPQYHSLASPAPGLRNLLLSSTTSNIVYILDTLAMTPILEHLRIRFHQHSFNFGDHYDFHRFIKSLPRTVATLELGFAIPDHAHAQLLQNTLGGITKLATALATNFPSASALHRIVIDTDSTAEVEQTCAESLSQVCSARGIDLVITADYSTDVDSDTY